MEAVCVLILYKICNVLCWVDFGWMPGTHQTTLSFAFYPRQGKKN